MNEIIQAICQKTGISEDQAKTATDTVIGFLKKKLPAPIAAQLDGALSGGGAAKSMGGLGGMLGGDEQRK